MGGALLELKLPTGIPAYDMETLVRTGGPEDELLLPRGVLWRVGSYAVFEKDKHHLPHVAKKFSNVIEAKLFADPNWPTT